MEFLYTGPSLNRNPLFYFRVPNLCHTFSLFLIESFRFEDENEDEDEDEALGFRHKELFRLQLGRDNVVAINFVVPAKLKTKKFEDFVVAKTESFVFVLDFVLVLESKAL